MVGESESDPRAPCQGACPAGTDAGRYVGLVAQGRYDEAYAVAAEVNPFPSVCGWICTAPCESACRRGTLDEPIAIRTLKRFAAEHGRLPAVPRPTTRRAEKVAIVGGGPAGMSAAYYLARLGYPVTVLEAMPELLTTVTLPPLPTIRRPIWRMSTFSSTQTTIPRPSCS